MLNLDKAQDIFRHVMQFAKSSSDETEMFIAGGRNALTRFANNAITQNVAEEDYVISVRVVLGGRTARATTNKFDEPSIKRLVESAVNLAKVQQPDPDLLPIVGRAASTESGPTIGRTYFETASLTPADRANAVAEMVGVAKKAKLTSAGIFADSESVQAMVNSQGLAVFHSQTSAEVSVTMLAPDSSGWQKFNSPDVRDVHAKQLAEIAAEKALTSASPRELAPGKYTVILEPAAVLDLLGFMFWDFAGQSVLDERSFLNNRIGEQLFGTNITITDDVYHPLQSGAAFDGEGVRRQRVELVKNGVVQRLVYARGTAEKMKKSELANKVGPIDVTGHGFLLPNEIGEAPMNIVVAGALGGASKTVSEMVAGTERGVLVTRLWYIREVDPYEKILTGMTRDGTFYVENGRIQHGLRNFRFNESLLSMLKNVQEMGESVRASGEESFDMVVPAMKVRDFNFTEVTKF